MESAIIGLLVFEGFALFVIIILLMRITRKIDMSVYWKELLDAKVKAIIYKMRSDES